MTSCFRAVKPKEDKPGFVKKTFSWYHLFFAHPMLQQMYMVSLYQKILQKQRTEVGHNDYIDSFQLNHGLLCAQVFPRNLYSHVC